MSLMTHENSLRKFMKSFCMQIHRAFEFDLAHELVKSRLAFALILISQYNFL